MPSVDEMSAKSAQRPRGAVTLLPDPETEPLWCPIISVDDHL